jgi:hypothetical protein
MPARRHRADPNPGAVRPYRHIALIYRRFRFARGAAWRHLRFDFRRKISGVNGKNSAQQVF